MYYTKRKLKNQKKKKNGGGLGARLDLSCIQFHLQLIKHWRQGSTGNKVTYIYIYIYAALLYQYIMNHLQYQMELIESENKDLRLVDLRIVYMVGRFRVLFCRRGWWGQAVEW